MSEFYLLYNYTGVELVGPFPDHATAKEWDDTHHHVIMPTYHMADLVRIITP